MLLIASSPYLLSQVSHDLPIAGIVRALMTHAKKQLLPQARAAFEPGLVQVSLGPMQVSPGVRLLGTQTPCPFIHVWSSIALWPHAKRPATEDLRVRSDLTHAHFNQVSVVCAPKEGGLVRAQAPAEELCIVLYNHSVPVLLLHMLVSFGWKNAHTRGMYGQLWCCLPCNACMHYWLCN